jgi:hypothetical protein
VGEAFTSLPCIRQFGRRSLGKVEKMFQSGNILEIDGAQKAESGLPDA